MKRLELAWRRFCIRLLVRFLAKPRRDTPPDWGSRPHRVLFLRPDRIGDMIVSTGLIRAIATAHPTIALDVLASPRNAEVLLHNPHVHDAPLFDRGRPGSWRNLLRTLRRARYDAVVDCMVFSPSLTTLLLMWASGAEERVGVGGRSHDAVFTLPIRALQNPEAHHVEHLAGLAEPFGQEPSALDHRPEIFITGEEAARAERLWQTVGDGPRLLVNVSAGKVARRWPEERFAELILLVRQRHPALSVLVIGMRAEAPSLSAIAERSGAGVATPSLRDTFAAVAAADIVFTPDTSIVHAATAFGKPCVVMYVRGTSRLWSPWRTPFRGLSSPDKFLRSVPRETATEALEQLLAETGIA